MQTALRIGISLLALVVATGTADAAFNVSVDATALTDQNIGVHPVANGHSSAVLSLPVDAGNYRFIGGHGNHTTFHFTVDNAGKVQFDEALDGFVSGRGTDTLVVAGYTFQADATAMTPQATAVHPLSGQDTTGTRMHTMIGIPGLYIFKGGHGNHTTVIFTVGNDGTIGFEPALDGFVSGRGTDTLVVTGYEFHADATALSPQPNNVRPLSGQDHTGTRMHTMTGVPGLYLFIGGYGNWTTFKFTVENDGTIDFDPTLDEFVSGRATDTLVVTGYSLTVDVRGLAPGVSHFGLQSIDQVGHPNSAPFTHTLIPGLYLLSAGGTMTFEFDLDGKLFNLPATHLGEPVTGEGGNVLRIGDSTPPVLDPSASKTTLWPPDHRMVEVTIDANATDDSGDAVLLEATISSSEEEGDNAPDAVVVEVNQSTGVVSLSLRAERDADGPGRTYTVTITGTDSSGNSAEVEFLITVPHDQGD